MRVSCLSGFLVIELIKFVYCQAVFPTFAEYVKKYDKQYEEKEYHERKKIYDQNILNFLNITDYEPGINNMTDWKP